MIFNYFFSPVLGWPNGLYNIIDSCQMKISLIILYLILAIHCISVDIFHLWKMKKKPKKKHEIIQYKIFFIYSFMWNESKQKLLKLKIGRGCCDVCIASTVWLIYSVEFTNWNFVWIPNQYQYLKFKKAKECSSSSLHGKYVTVPKDKASNNIVFVC